MWDTVLRPSILTVYQVAPERLELNTLYDNIRVLGSNAQKTSRFEIAFWNKVFYPVGRAGDDDRWRCRSRISSGARAASASASSPARCSASRSS